MASDHKPYTQRDKLLVTIMAVLLFIVVSSPYLYSTVNRFTSSCLGWTTASKDGLPNLGGLLLHGVVFGVITWVLMK